MKHYYNLFALKKPLSPSLYQTSLSYNMTVPRQKVKLTTDVQEIIDEQILKNKMKLEDGLRKQMMKKKDIHE